MRKLVITGGYATELLEFAKETFNDVPFLVMMKVASPRVYGVGFRRYAIRSPFRCDVFTYRGCPICLVAPNTTLPESVTPGRASTATRLSLTLPGVRHSLTGLPRASTTAWIFVSLPPLESPMFWFLSAFSAPFLRLLHVGALCRRCCLWTRLAYLRLW